MVGPGVLRDVSRRAQAPEEGWQPPLLPSPTRQVLGHRTASPMLTALLISPCATLVAAAWERPGAGTEPLLPRPPVGSPLPPPLLASPVPGCCPAPAAPAHGPLLCPALCCWGCMWLLKGYTAMALEWYCSNHKRACTKRRNFPIFPIKDFSLGTFCSLCPRTDGSASSVPGLQIQPKAPVRP